MEEKEKKRRKRRSRQIRKNPWHRGKGTGSVMLNLKKIHSSAVREKYFFVVFHPSEYLPFIWSVARTSRADDYRRVNTPL